MAVDGVEVVSRRNLLPVVGREADRVALRCWSPTLIHDITVERLEYDRNIPATAIGPRTALQRRHIRSCHRTRAGLQNGLSGDAQVKALTQAFLAASLDPQLSGTRQRLMARLRKDHNGSRPSPIANMPRSSVCGDRGNPGAALRMLRDMPDQHQASDLAVEILAVRPIGLSESQLKELFALLPRDRIIPMLNLSEVGLTDLELLRGLKIVILQARKNAISDLSPLAGMPLRHLSINDNPVSDLAPIANCPIERLDVQNSSVASTKVIAGMTALRDLNISYTPIQDLTGLESLRLVRLEMNGIPLMPPQTLRDMPLQTLSIGHPEMTDLDALRGHQLSTLWVSAGRIASLEPLRGMRISELGIVDNLVVDLSPLTGMPLTKINLTGNRISSLEPLNGLPLTRLQISRNRITSLQPLRRARLTVLEAADNPLSEEDPLQAIAYQPLYKLDVSNCGITSLRALSGLTPGIIELRGNPITSLASLEQTRVSQQLGLVDCPVTPEERLGLAAAGKPEAPQPSSFAGCASRRLLPAGTAPGCARLPIRWIAGFTLVSRLPSGKPERSQRVTEHGFPHCLTQHRRTA